MFPETRTMNSRPCWDLLDRPSRKRFTMFPLVKMNHGSSSDGGAGDCGLGCFQPRHYSQTGSERSELATSSSEAPNPSKDRCFFCSLKLKRFTVHSGCMAKLAAVPSI